jgi:hypothetical protein
MKHFKFSLQFVAVIVFLIFPFLNIAQNSAEKHMLWKISSGNAVEGYLAGSIHVVKPDMYPLAPVFQKTFEKADVIGFELNLDSMKIKAPALVPKLAFYQNGDNLKDKLSPETYKKVSEKMQGFGMPMMSVNRMEPWFVALTLTAMEMQKSGYSEEGIDQHFYKLAKENNKEVMALETAEFQLGIFDKLAEKQQIDYLEFAMTEGSQNADQIDEITKYWKAGQAEKLSDLTQGEMKKISEKLYDQLLTQRNLNWVPKIEKILETDQIPMIVVGAAHLVGPDSVVGLLEKKGYKVEQM